MIVDDEHDDWMMYGVTEANTMRDGDNSNSNNNHEQQKNGTEKEEKQSLMNELKLIKLINGNLAYLPYTLF